MSEYKLFERYISKKLSDSELKHFESKLNSDEDFKKSYEEHVTLHQAFDIILEKDVKAVMLNLDSKKKSGFAYRYKKWFLKAACLIVLVVAVCAINPELSGLGIVSITKEYSPDRGAGEKAEIESGVIHQIEQIEKHFVANPTTENMTALIRDIKNVDKAKLSLKQKDQLEFYRALAEVGIDKKSGKLFLKKIVANKDHNYYSDASKVLEQWSFVKRLWNKIVSYVS